MIDFTDIPEEVRELVNDYHIHLIPIRKLSKEELDYYQSDLKQVFKIVQCSEDKKRMRELIVEATHMPELIQKCRKLYGTAWHTG